MKSERLLAGFRAGVGPNLLWWWCSPLGQRFALVFSGRLQVLLQTLLLRLQLLRIVGLQALAGADVLQLLQKLLLLVDEDEAVSLRVQQTRPRLTVQFSDLHLDVGDPERKEERTDVMKGPTGSDQTVWIW